MQRYKTFLQKNQQVKIYQFNLFFPIFLRIFGDLCTVPQFKDLRWYFAEITQKCFYPVGILLTTYDLLAIIILKRGHGTFCGYGLERLSQDILWISTLLLILHNF